jgi:hypothetical protein
MKLDLYTKAILTVIALMLVVIACKTVIAPETTASAQGPFAGVQFTSDTGQMFFFDTRTGEGWEYNYKGGRPEVWDKWRVTKLGQPIVVTCQGPDNCRGK